MSARKVYQFQEQEHVKHGKCEDLGNTSKIEKGGYKVTKKRVDYRKRKNFLAKRDSDKWRSRSQERKKEETK